MLADFFAHQYADDPDAAAKEAVDDDFDIEAELAKADAVADGKLVDDWEEI